MKRHLGPAAAGAVAIGLLAGCSSGTSAATTATSATATTAASPTPAPVTISGTAGPSPTTGRAAVCGPWSSSTSALAHAVASRYGGIESCFLYGHTWVITTDGLNGGPGYVGLAATCADSACLSGSGDPGTFDTWTYFAAAKPGTVKLYAAPAAGMPLQITVGGSHETFDLTTKAFGTNSQPSKAATLPLIRSCTSGDLVGELRNVSLPDGLVQGEVTIVNTSTTPCAVHATLARMVPLTSAGLPLLVPAGELPGPVNGVGVPYTLNAGLPSTTLVSGRLPDAAPGGIVLTVGGDPSARSCAAKDRLTKPAAFRFSIGSLNVTVVNHDPQVPTAAVAALYGCPARFYVGSVNGR